MEKLWPNWNIAKQFCTEVTSSVYVCACVRVCVCTFMDSRRVRYISGMALALSLSLRLPLRCLGSSGSSLAFTRCHSLTPPSSASSSIGVSVQVSAFTMLLGRIHWAVMTYLTITYKEISSVLLLFHLQQTILEVSTLNRKHLNKNHYKSTTFRQSFCNSVTVITVHCVNYIKGVWIILFS